MTLLITDWDLDGIGSIILAQVYNLPIDKYKISSPIHVNDNDVLQEIMQHETTYITDLSLNKTNLNILMLEEKDVRILDHHKTSDYLNTEYPNCISDITRCGTRLFFEEVILKSCPGTKACERFVELIDTYDRYIKDSPLWEDANKLNRIFQYNNNINVWTFINRYIKKLQNNPDEFIFDSLDEEQSLATLKEIFKAYKFSDELLHMFDQGHIVYGVTYYTNYITEVGAELLRQHGLAFVILINNKYKNKASGRSVTSFDLTRLPGFKGHANAAGGIFDETLLESWYNNGIKGWQTINGSKVYFK